MDGQDGQDRESRTDDFEISNPNFLILSTLSIHVNFFLVLNTLDPALVPEA
jgi:hypothetical protein